MRSAGIERYKDTKTCHTSSSKAARKAVATLRIVEDTDALFKLEPAWNRLADRCGDEGFFGRHTFVRAAWARHRIDRRRSLHVIVVEHCGEMLLALPLVRRRDLASVSTLRWLDSRTPLYNDALIDPAADIDAVAGMVRQHLLSLRWAWRLKVGFVRRGTPTARLMRRLGARRRPHMTSFGLELTSFTGWDDYLARRKSEFRSAYRRMLRRIGDYGRVEIERIADAGRLPAEISWIFAVKRQWVLERYGKPNWASPAETEKYFCATAIALAARGQAFVLRLTCEDRRVAAVLVYRGCHTDYLSKSAYDPEWRKYSPGWLINLESIRAALEDGVERIDFMMGQEPWKDRLMDTVCEIDKYDLLIHPMRTVRR